MWGLDRRKDRGPSWNGSMLGALIIVFREVIEAGLIVGIVMAATHGVAGRGRWIGSASAPASPAPPWWRPFAGGISQAFEGAGQELFNASVLGVAVVMLMWHNAWMARHGREIAAEMRDIGTAVSEGAKPLTALAVVVGLAVLREGSEVVLFLYGIFASGTSGLSLLTGGLLGVAAGAAFTALTYFGLLAIPYALHLLGDELADRAARRRHGGAVGAVPQQCRVLVVAFDRTVWDTSWLLSEGSIFGQLLHTLIGYTERPTEMQLLVYVATLLAMYALDALARHRPQRARGGLGALFIAQRGEGDIRRPVDQLEQRAGGTARIALALLPVAHGLDRHLDLFGEGRLRQPAARPHLAHEGGRVGVIERLLAAVGKDFDDPPVGLQAHPKHGPLRHWWCRLQT